MVADLLIGFGTLGFAYFFFGLWMFYPPWKRAGGRRLELVAASLCWGFIFIWDFIADWRTSRGK